MRGRSGPRTAPIPRWYTLVCAGLAVPVIAVGVSLYTNVRAIGAHWPWPLTPIAAQAIAAWLVALALLLAGVAAEADWARTRPAQAAMVCLAVLQLIALLRYPAIPHGIAALGWSTLFVAVGAIGGYGLVRGRSASGPPATPGHRASQAHWAAR